MVWSCEQADLRQILSQQVLYTICLIVIPLVLVASSADTPEVLKTFPA